MKKLLIYLILIAWSGSFISATPGFLYKKKENSNPNINISDKDQALQQDDASGEINTLNIFYIRYF
jgi:hypothetical protein